jgi:MFS family permease
MTVTWFGTYWGVVLHVTSEWGWTALRAGLATSPVPLLSGATGILVNRVSLRTGPRRYILAGTGLLLATPVVTWLSIGETPSVVAVVLNSALLGVASGCILTPFMTAAMVHVPRAQHALATGLSFMTQRLATTFGVAVAITFLTRPGGLDGLHRCLVVTALGAVALAGFGSRLRVPLAEPPDGGTAPPPR